MTKWTRVVVLGGITIICFDALASIASQQLGFAYSKAWYGSNIIYAGVGFLATQATGSIARGALAAGLIGIVESTLGWWVSWLIGPGRIPTGPPSLLQLLVVVVSVAGIGACLGAFGGWVRTWRRSARTTAR